ncbi:NHS actin remodeling regulator GUK-holder isoform X3 [Rhynchophorus ferrugineus]|uniref:NHS actin remodeling regulator GUK-holder isoform X3 n=1 Tax=Rhynchophorus ferrugineus TaxID=354439 RepID=UPI003FCDA247
MPFVQRVVEPKLLSRVQLFREDGSARVQDGELEAVTNFTLCSALRQLASLSAAADDIFKELGGQLKLIYGRCEDVKAKLVVLGEKVEKFDPRKVPVPVGDICSFAQTKEHYAAKHQMDTSLFGPESRPQALKLLYEAASKTPVHAMRQLDRWRRDGHRSSKFFVCTPVLGARRRKIRGKVDIDIETRMPAVIEDLRRWTSDEALGDITVGPYSTSRITTTLTEGDVTDGTIASDDEAIDHKLPSPEEQLQVVALRFPAEIVAVDISGRSFDRMSSQRRSLMTGEIPNQTTDGETVRRRGRTRRPRNRRRNTLAGTDQKEIQDVLSAGDEQTLPASTSAGETKAVSSSTVHRSKSSDLLRSSQKKESSDAKVSRFNSLKQWGKSKYDKLLNKSNEKNDSNSSGGSSSGIKTKTSTSDDGVNDFNLYDTVTMKRRRDLDKERKTHERNSSISSSEKSLPVNGSTLSSAINIEVKLRESSLQRRQRRAGNNKDEPHSSSGNWSASSESGRASIGSEITSTTHPKSTTSAATSNNSLHPPSSVNSRRRFNFNTSTSGSVTSEGSTLTPDIIHDLHEDGDSVYSCDTEGYYTSFHMDSGLKTLKEEELPTTPLQSPTAFCNSDSNNTVMSAENEYELFGRGSTSTTTSSAGTVCTTLRAAESNKSLIMGPAVPERKSSLSKLSNKSSKSPEESLARDYIDKTGTIKRSPALSNSKPTIVALIEKKHGTGGDVSPDSGHNTSSSPIESVSSPNGVRSGSDFEFSESSDMEGPERIERIRVKTTINSSRIPSMCAITPPHSDDESSSNSSYKKQIEKNNLKNSLDHDKENGNVNIDQRIISTNVNGTQKLSLVNVNVQSGYATVENLDENIIPAITVTSNAIRAPSPSGGSVTVKSEQENNLKTPSQPMIKSSLLPLNNMFGKIKSNLTNLGLTKRERSKSPGQNKLSETQMLDSMDEYVTLADVRNNNEKFSVDENTYVNDTVNKNLNTVLSGKIRDAEYVSLNELPNNENNNLSPGGDSSLERTKRQGARVMLDAEGKVVYSSDSLRRRKPPSTFEPGPFVKLSSPKSSPQMHRALKSIRPISSAQDQMKLNIPQTEFSRPMSPNSGNKVIIKASGNAPEVVRAPTTVVQPASPKMRPLSPKGAYVHVQAPGGSLSPKELREGVNPPQTSSTSPRLGRYPEQEEMFTYANNDGYYYQGGNFYSTLPTKKSQYFAYDAPPERSVTPDITRGLDKGTGSLPRSNTFKSDQNLISYGRHVEFSVGDYQYASSHDDSLRISPIDPVRNSGGFKSSTPSSQMKASANLESKLLSPKRSTMSNEELYAVIHKTKKKLNIEDDLNRASPAPVEPETSTPKKMNVETGYIGSRQSWSPSKGEYIDFNSDIDKFSPINEPKNRQSWACSDRKGTKKTSTMDFKRLLLQKSSALSSNKKMSAVEQLKLSKQQMQQQKEQQTTSGSPKPSGNPGNMTILDLSASPRSLVNRRLLNNPTASPERVVSKPTPKILSPRSNWRFLNQRSNVLSTPILEDCREDDTSSNASRSSLEKRNNQSIQSPNNVDTKPTQSSFNKEIDNSSKSVSVTGNSEHNPSTKYSSVSERLSAQRAQFFGTTGIQKAGDSAPKLPPPTLETAF